MTQLYKCTLTNRRGQIQEQFFARGCTALEVFSKIQACLYCDGRWDIEATAEEKLLDLDKIA